MKRFIAFATAVCAAVMCLCSCSVGFIGGSSTRYDNAGKYTSGDREFTGGIDELDIDWPSGSVTVTAADTSAVTVRETTKGELSDELKVHTWAEGSLLHVRFCKSGERYDKNEPKTVEITVPKDMLYKYLSIDVSSADVVCEGVSAERASIDASSGDTVYNGRADSFTADSSSGDISFSGESSFVKTDASSGDIKVDQKGRADGIYANTSSGSISITAEYAAEVTVGSSSGSQQLSLAEMPAKVKLDASSGDITLALPEDAGFTADIDTSSGSVDFQLPMQKEGGDTYICGSGENKLTVETTSGNVKILKLQ